MSGSSRRAATGRSGSPRRAALVGISLAFFQVWLLVIAMVLLLFAIGGLVFEYHIRPSDH